MATQTQATTAASSAAAAAPKAAPKPGVLQRIIIDIEDGFKHVVLDIPEAETVLAEVAAATGNKAAGTAAAILGLAKAAIAAYDNAGKVQITPAEIAKLLPDTTPLANPAAAKPAASQGAATASAAAE